MSNIHILDNHLYLDFHTHQENEDYESIFRIRSFDISEYKKIKIPFTIGLHPWYVTKESRKQIPDIQEISSEPNCLGIGEVGLDSARGGDKKLQTEILEQVIEISMKVGKPLILHIVKSYDIFEEFIKKYKTPLPWVIHGFSKNPKLAKAYLQKGIFLSFGHRVLDSKIYESFFSEILPDAYFLETDDSGIKIQVLYEKLSKLTGLNIREISILQKELYKKVFGSHIFYEF